MLKPILVLVGAVLLSRKRSDFQEFGIDYMDPKTGKRVCVDEEGRDVDCDVYDERLRREGFEVI